MMLNLPHQRLAFFLKQVVVILSSSLASIGLAGNFAIAQVNLDDIKSSIKSAEFESLCAKPKPSECQDIGKAADISLVLIYSLFDAESIQNVSLRKKVIQRISELYNAAQVDTINKRLTLPEIFNSSDQKIFGGYAVLIRSQPTQLDGKNKLRFVIAFKGTTFRLDDPNDIAASFAVSPKVYLGLHEGIKNYASTVFNESLSQTMLAEILRLQSDPSNDIEVILTGHSLGVASFFYAAMLKDAGVSPKNIKIIVFGAPLFAEASFANKYRDLVSGLTRVETEGDILRNEKDSPMKLAYDVLGFVPLGKLVKAETTTKKIVDLNRQREDLEKKMRASPSLDLVPTYLSLQQQIFQEKLSIHLYSYRYFYDYYLSIASKSP